MRALLYVVPIALAVYALVDLARSRPADRAGLRRWVWVLLVLVPVLGPVAWLLVSRRARGAQGPGPSSGGARGRGPRRPGPVAPDDDPDFLWRLEQEQRRARRRAGDADEPSEGGPRDVDDDGRHA